MEGDAMRFLKVESNEPPDGLDKGGTQEGSESEQEDTEGALQIVLNSDQEKEELEDSEREEITLPIANSTKS